MNQSHCEEWQLEITNANSKAWLEAELEREQRISRRQVLLKALWKLDQKRSEQTSEPEPAHQST